MSNENDDLLDPAEIDALLNTISSGSPAARPAPEVAAAAPAPAAAHSGPADGATSGDIERLFDNAAAGLQAAVATDSARAKAKDPLAEARPFEFQPFDDAAEAGNGSELGNLKDVELDLQIELGRAELLLDEVLKLRQGSVVPLDKLAGDPVDILVNGRLIARGEVLVLNDNFCVRVAEILAPPPVE